MPVDKKEVLRIAQLARLKLDESEAESFVPEMEAMIRFADMLSQADTEGLEPSGSAGTAQNVFREDVSAPSADRDALLANAPDRDNGCFLVPKTVKNTGPHASRGGAQG